MNARHSGGVSRRAILRTAALGIALKASASPAQTSPPGGFGAPLTEVYVPSGVLTLEQKSAMIKGISDVLRRVTGLSADQGPMFVEIIETSEGGFGVNGRVFAPRPSK
jgi:4-oxalocrotonate tautomerase